MVDGGVKVTVGDGIVKSACRMCHGVCGVLVHIKDGKVVRVTGDPDCPTNRGYICEKGRASVELLYHPDRLKYPLKRKGIRGANNWERIGWDEALDTIAAKYREFRSRYGARSIAMATGTGRPYLQFANLFAHAAGIGSMLNPSHICYYPRLAASWFTCGQLPVCDYYGFGGRKPACVVVWGCNIEESGAADGMAGHQLALARREGAKTIVIDPRKTPTAARADLWLQIRPGTDDALALGLINVIVREDLYDHDFVQRWTVGWENLKEAVKAYTPGRVAEITWLPADLVAAAARMYATSRPAAIQWGCSVPSQLTGYKY